MSRNLAFGLSVVVLLALSANSHAAMVITEWMYDGAGGEFMEFTNVGGSPIDMTNWSQDDSTGTPGKHAFGSTFGIVQPGESVIVTESLEATFRAAWNMPASVKVFGPYSNDNLGRNDAINLYDNLNTLVATLTYNDQGAGNVAGPRTSGASGNIPLAGLGVNNASLAVLSSVGDVYGSYAGPGGAVGNPGVYTQTVPEPATLTLLAITAAVGAAVRRRRV